MRSGAASKQFAVPLTYLHYALIGARGSWMSMRFPPARPADPRVSEVVAELDRKGWALIDGYLSAELCRSAKASIDRLIDDPAPGVRQEYAGAEHRYFGAEALSPAIAQFHDDLFLRQIAERYMETQIVNICTMANKSLKASSATQIAGRWHRDSFGKQIKAIAYLVDVDESNGAFEFIPGSNRLSRIVSDIRRAGLHAFQWRLSDEDVWSLGGPAALPFKKLVAPAGSVILVDTSMIHRASPVTANANARYALTNYYIERGRYRRQICEGLGVRFRPDL